MAQSSITTGVREKYQALSPILHEKARRCWAACEALSLGYGGISLVATATGLSRPTIRRGISEIQAGDLGRDDTHPADLRIRHAGGGRYSLAEADPRLLADLRRLVDPATRGDPMSPLLWTCKSTRNLADALTTLGHDLSHQTVGRLLTDLGYSLQSNRKTEEGKDHPDRDAQFEQINGRVRRFQRRGQPVVSVDTKKKEIVGNYKNSGRERQPKGRPRRVKSKDFPDKELGKVAPYGIYDLTANEGWVNVGIDHDTAEFAVESIRRWWYRMGHAVYPGARELLITADSGGSNGSRNRLWKVSLQSLLYRLGEHRISAAVSHGCLVINGRPGSRLLRPPARRPTPSVQVRSRPAPQESCDPERLEKASGWTRMDRRVKFLQSAAKSVSPPRLLSQSSAWGESSEPCRTSSTDRRVVALPHPRWQGTTERFAPLISRWCQPPVVTLPNPQPPV